MRRATRDGTASTSTYLWEDRGVVCGILVDRGVLRGVCSVLRFPPPKDIAALEFGGRRAVLVARQEAVVAMYPPRDIVLVSLVMQRNRWSREVGASRLGRVGRATSTQVRFWDSLKTPSRPLDHS